MAGALGVVGLLVGWPATAARDIPARMQAELLAACRDALADRYHVDLQPDVLSLPQVRHLGANRYRLTGSMVVDSGASPFSCDVQYGQHQPQVGELRILSW
jgi:hypothetical protein